jgi:hypothetical protein
MKKLLTCGSSAIKNYVADLCGGFNEQLEKERVLLSTTSPRSAATHELSVICHQQGCHTECPEAFWRAYQAGSPIHYALYELGKVL